MKTRRKNPAGRRAPAELTEAAPDRALIKISAGALQGVMMEVVAVITAGLAGAAECAMAALPADMTEDARAKVRDAMLLSGITTIVGIGRISVDEDRRTAFPDDEPARAALAAALLTSLSCNALVQDDFIRGITDACRPPLH